MLTITTATGKTFETDYAVCNDNIGIAFVRILGHDKETIERIFENGSELPFDRFPKYKKLQCILDEQDAIKLMLNIESEVTP